MLGRIRKETLIACEDKRFRIDDIVTIKTIFSKEYSGRIKRIDDKAFVIDMSDKYRAEDKTFYYGEIISIEYCGEREI